jgi:hypothetical protein
MRHTVERGARSEERGARWRSAQIACTRRHQSAARITPLLRLQAMMSRQHTFPIHIGSATSPDLAPATDASSSR